MPAGRQTHRAEKRRPAKPGRRRFRLRVGPPSGETWALLAGAALVVALRLACALPLAGSPLFLHPVLDDAPYQNRALAIHEGRWLDESLPRGSVLYPYLLNLVPGTVAGGAPRLAVVQSILEGVTALLLLLWLRRRLGARAALAAAILYALDPMGGFFAARFSPVVPATLAFVAALWLWDREEARERQTVVSALAFGIVAALGFLLQPLPFLALVGLRAWFALRRGAAAGRAAWGRALAPIACLALLGGLVIAQHAGLPDGGPVLGWGGGPALSNALNPATGGTPRGLHPPSWLPEEALKTEAWEGLGREGSRYDLFRFYVSRGLTRALENPFGTLGVLLTKAIGTIGAYPIPDALSASFAAGRYARIFAYLKVSFALLLGLGAAGWLWLRGSAPHRILGAGLLAAGIGSLLGMASAASRQPALPLLAALGGAWLAGAGSRAASSRGLTAGVLLGVVVVSLAAGWLSPTSALRNPSEDLRLLASAFAQTASLRQAEPYLEDAIQADPRNLDARAALAQAYQQDGLINAAADQLKAAFAADSTHTATLFGLSMLHQAREEPDEALAMMTRLVRLRPNNPLYLNELAQMLMRRNDLATAQVLLQRALRLKPDYLIAQKNLEVVETYLRHLERSLVPPEMHLAQNDPLTDAGERIVQAMDAESWSEADSLITWAEQERPGLVQPHWFRAAYNARRGDLPGAITALETCQRLAPGRPLVVQQLIVLYQQTGRPEKIEPLLRESLASARGDSVRAAALGSMLAQFRQASGGR